MKSLSSPLNTIKHVLQGKGLSGHPLHVAINHVPLGLWEGAVIFDLMARRRKWRKLGAAGYYMHLWGVGAAVPTALTGLAEWWDIPTDHPAWKVATTHAALNDLALGLALYNWWSRRDRHNFAPDTTNVWVDGALLAVLGVSGYLGGMIAHEYGYGTHRQGSSVAKERESLVGPQEQIYQPKTILTDDAPNSSLDSWAGAAAGEVKERDAALEAEMFNSAQNREVGGSGI